MQGKRNLQRYVLTLGGVGRVGRFGRVGHRSKLFSRMMMRSTVKVIMTIVTAKWNKMTKCFFFILNSEQLK